MAPCRAYCPDLRAVLTADRERRIAQGWEVEDIGPVSAFYFATLAGARHYVGIEAREPRGLLAKGSGCSEPAAVSRLTPRRAEEKRRQTETR